MKETSVATWEVHSLLWLKGQTWDRSVRLLLCHTTSSSSCRVRNRRRKGMSEQHRIFNIDQWLHIRRHYRANFNSTFPSLQYIWNYLTINSQAHLVLEKYFIVPRKRHFLWREIILHQICKSTLKHKSYLYYPMLQGTHNVQVCLRN